MTFCCVKDGLLQCERPSFTIWFVWLRCRFHAKRENENANHPSSVTPVRLWLWRDSCDGWMRGICHNV